MESKQKFEDGFENDALGNDDAFRLAERIRRSELSAEEAIEAAIQRAEKWNPKINAIVTKTYDRARAQAKQLGQKEGGALFSGVPTFVKDNSRVEGVPTTWGSSAMTAPIATSDSLFVKQFLSTGLISLGKSTLPEFGLTGTTESLAHGATRNPWNLEHSAGGSSGGAAALVAARVVPIAHGNDGGGSIRIPASCCGVVGMKVSRGRLLIDPLFNKVPFQLICDGVLTRSVRDTAHFLFESQKYFSNSKLPRLPEVNELEGKKKFRIAYFTKPFTGGTCDPEIVSATEKAAKLCESLGHQVEKVGAIFPGSFAEDFFLYWGFLSYASCRSGKALYGPSFETEKTEILTRGLANHFRKRVWKFPLALWRLKSLSRVYREYFDQFDLFLSPTLSRLPAKIGFLRPDQDFKVSMEKLRDFFPFTPPLNVIGAPAISLPLAWSQGGLPIGIQVAGAVGRDEDVLRMAFELEANNV